MMAVMARSQETFADIRIPGILSYVPVKKTKMVGKKKGVGKQPPPPPWLNVCLHTSPPSMTWHVF